MRTYFREISRAWFEERECVRLYNAADQLRDVLDRINGIDPLAELRPFLPKRENHGR